MSAESNDVRDIIAAQAAEFFVARREGRTSAAEDRQFLEWLRASPIHVAEYMALALIAKDAANAARQLDIPLDDLIAEAKADGAVVPLHAMTSGAASQPARRAAWRRPLMAAAFAIAAVLVGVWRWAEPAGHVYSTMHGEQRTLQLADNSVVRLDSDSTIAVTFDRRARTVELVKGQVYFEVAKDPSRPFHVRAGETVIDDIGTAFDVYRKPTDMVVTVVDGVVNVHKDASAVGQSDSPAYLRAGDQAIISSSGLVKTQKLDSVQRSIAWMQNEILFEKETVASVVAEFNRYNRTQIVVDDPTIAALTISGVFQAFDVRSFTQFLAELPNVRIIESGQTINVTAVDHRG